MLNDFTGIKMVRRGFSLVAVLVFMFLSMFVISALSYIYLSGLKSYSLEKKATLLDETAKSGIEVGLVRLKKGEKDAFPISGSLNNCSYTVSLEDKGGGIYELVSTASCGGAEKTIKVTVASKSSEWIPFYANSFIVKDFDTYGWDPDKTKIFANSYEINGLTGEDAKQELENAGFDVLNSANPPDIDVVPFDTASVNLPSPPPFPEFPSPSECVYPNCVICEDGASVREEGNQLVFDNCSVNSIPYSDISDELRLYSKGNLTVETNLSKLFHRSTLEKLLFSSEGKIEFKEGISIQSRNFDSLALEIYSIGDIVSDKSFNIGRLKSNSDINFQLISYNGNVNLPEIISSGFGNERNLKLSFFSGRELSIGDLQLGNFGAKNDIEVLVSARDGIDISTLRTQGLNAGGKLNFSILSGGELSINRLISGNLGAGGISGDLDFVLGSKGDMNLNEIDLIHFSAGSSIGLKIMSEGSADLGEIKLGNFSANSDISVEVLSNGFLSMKSFSPSNFGGGGRGHRHRHGYGRWGVSALSNLNLLLEGKKGMVLDTGISLSNFSFKGFRSIVLLSEGDIVSKNGGLLNFSDFGFPFFSGVSTVAFVVAKGNVISLNNGSSYLPGHHGHGSQYGHRHGRRWWGDVASLINLSNFFLKSDAAFLVWGQQGVVGEVSIRNISFPFLKSNLFLSLVSKGKTNLGKFSTPSWFFSSSYLAGLDRETLKNLCSGSLGKVSEIACAIVNGTGEPGEGELKIIKWESH